MNSSREVEIKKMYEELWDIHFRSKDQKPIQIMVEFYRYTTLKNTIRKREGTIYFRISDILEDAPEDVIAALGIILFCKLNRKRTHESDMGLYRDYVNSKKIQNRVRRTRQARSRKRITGSNGRFYDLEKSFIRINGEYFGGTLQKPQLTWSQKKTKCRFGHHDESHNTIVISRTLDDERLPRCLLDYVMYHEALHLKHGRKYRNGRRWIHTRAFKDDERKFRDYEYAKSLLKKLSGRSSAWD